MKDEEMGMQIGRFFAEHGLALIAAAGCAYLVAALYVYGA